MTVTTPVIRGMTSADWPEVVRIWAAGIATGDATFEPSPPSWAGFDAVRLPHLRLVAGREPGDPLLGWAAAGPMNQRRAYAGVARHSVYVAGDTRGGGVGRALLEALITAAEAAGVWTLSCGIFPENTASRRLHARCGFTELGVQRRIGRMDGRWRDVVLLERRSSAIGGDEPLVRLAIPGPDDAAAVRRLLLEAGLPPDGLDDAWRTWVADAEGTTGPVVGAAALERRRDSFLLRSVVVDPVQRGLGLGSRLVHAALTMTDLQRGRPAEVYLLTTTADAWFDRFGFAPLPREQLPAALRGSAELSGACPDDARAYRRPGA